MSSLILTVVMGGMLILNEPAPTFPLMPIEKSVQTKEETQYEIVAPHGYKIIQEGNKITFEPIPKPAPAPPVPKQEPVEEVWIPMEFTYYTADCDGCTGITSKGVDVRNTTVYNGMKVIAVNPAVIPYGSILEVDIKSERFKAIAVDTGVAMRKRTNLIDILVSTEDEAVANGRKQGKIRYVRKGY